MLKLSPPVIRIRLCLCGCMCVFVCVSFVEVCGCAYPRALVYIFNNLQCGYIQQTSAGNHSCLVARMIVMVELLLIMLLLLVVELVVLQLMLLEVLLLLLLRHVQHAGGGRSGRPGSGS